ncbi:uncharacterized protein SPAPADRAFT_63605 [Spathaspora passalidarum NRRL Y-27907]|uniref:Uncharacterized protein n=1 Tax=Spathaspora passalidarum (strain NRRL Y-27907 / 11-Y1) TaxID=619300 RepID=G3AVT5_SPAPN|nr:uncharacterized protein SPAPADRAFT_63605 [Spathaspora passalidarum NRRL Y-27907]EGW29980.1 hypothetical protein SPAPADRAFT_63605 [Spathaspora passalidarum NRRL Y-27907]
MIKGCLSRGRKIAETIPNSSPTQIGTCHIVQRHKSDSPPPAYNMSEIPLQPAPAYLPLYEQISSQQLQSSDELDRLNSSPTP